MTEEWLGLVLDKHEGLLASVRDPVKVFIGYDPSEAWACRVARQSLESHTSVPLSIDRISMDDLEALGLYNRPTETRKGKLWDAISEAPMSTRHAIARFFIPMLCGYEGIAIFTDGDVLFQKDIAQLIDLADSKYAVQVVPHEYEPSQSVKKSGDVQLRYRRKNWSSVMLWNCGHPSNKKLTLGLLNSLPGRDLHAFCWLQDSEIGFLPEEWNWLVGHSKAIPPAIVHFTEGLPDKPGYEKTPYSKEWRTAMKHATRHLVAR